MCFVFCGHLTTTLLKICHICSHMKSAETHKDQILSFVSSNVIILTTSFFIIYHKHHNFLSCELTVYIAWLGAVHLRRHHLSAASLHILFNVLCLSAFIAPSSNHGSPLSVRAAACIQFVSSASSLSINFWHTSLGDHIYIV